MDVNGLWIIIGAITATNIICLGIVVSQSLSKRHKPTTQHYHLDVKSTDLLPEDEMDIVRNQARDKIERAFGDTFSHFDQSLNRLVEVATATAEKQLKLTLSTEAHKFEDAMKQALESVQASARRVDEELKAEAAAMRAQLYKEIAEEKARKISDFEQRMATVVTAYMSEAFDGNEHLAAQTDAVIAWLNEHKNEIRKDLA